MQNQVQSSLEKHEIINQGLSAERIAKKWELSREELDRFSFESHQKAIHAINEGKFEDEIVSVDVMKEDGSTEMFSIDEGPRPESTTEVLAGLTDGI